MWFERGHYTSNIMIEGKVLTDGASGKFQRYQMDFEYQVGGFSETNLPVSVYDVQASYIAYPEAANRVSEISEYLQKDIRRFLREYGSASQLKTLVSCDPAIDRGLVLRRKFLESG